MNALHKNKGRLSFIVLAALAFSLCMPAVPARADTPYKTYTEGGYVGITETQTAYTPLTSITKIGELSFKNASDMQITKDDEIYIADTEGKRILVSDTEGNLLRIYGEGELKNPVGIFVTESKNLYVADKDAGRIVVFNEAGDLIKEYTKPDHPLYGSDVNFKPQKLAVDSKGIMYIVCEGNTNGIVQISPTGNGTFLGYFGTNKTMPKPLDVFRRMFLSDEQLAKLPRILPKTPYNLTIDSKGLVYTVTQGVDYSLRKFNVAGKNMIDVDYYDSLPSAVSVGNYENIYVVTEEGYIFEYNKDGSMLFVFGGKDSGRLRIGLFQKAVAVGVDQRNRVYVLDQEKNEIQVFQTTEFTDLVHEALMLYQDGKYTESKEPLTKIIEMNSLFDYANLAMGQALLQEEQYSEALRYFRMSQSYSGYSNAFWEVRNIWLRNNLIPSMGILVAFILLWKLIGYLHRRKQVLAPLVKLNDRLTARIGVKRLKYMFYYIKHPIDGAYGVKREGKASYATSHLLLIAFIGVFLLDKYASGFIVKRVSEGRYDIIGDVMYILGIVLLFTVSSYLISTINDGEGSMKQLYTAYIYSLGPYLILKPFIVVLSNVLTYNEVFLIRFSNFILYTWIIVLLFMTIKEVNNYSVGETVKVILITFFCALIVILLLFILYVLISQVADFVQAIYGEVVYRFENS